MYGISIPTEFMDILYVITKNIIETAEKFIPQMQEEGADIIVAIPHSGLDDPSIQIVTNAQTWYVEKYIQDKSV